MTIGDLLRRLFGKRNEDALPSPESTPAQPETAKALTEQDLEQVQGGASMVELPITSVPYYKVDRPPMNGDPNQGSIIINY
jgi:hypothetical protein